MMMIRDFTLTLALICVPINASAITGNELADLCRDKAFCLGYVAGVVET